MTDPARMSDAELANGRVASDTDAQLARRLIACAAGVESGEIVSPDRYDNIQIGIIFREAARRLTPTKAHEDAAREIVAEVAVALFKKDDASAIRAVCAALSSATRAAEERIARLRDALTTIRGWRERDRESLREILDWIEDVCSRALQEGDR